MKIATWRSSPSAPLRRGWARSLAGVVDAAMMTFPHNITAAESGFRELVSFIASDIIQLQGAIVTRDALLKHEPAVVEKFLRATIKGIIYYSTNRSGRVPILARNVKTQENLAAKIYDLVKPALTPEGILNDDLQKRIMAPLRERINKRDAAARLFDFALARKINGELKARGGNRSCCWDLRCVFTQLFRSQG